MEKFTVMPDVDMGIDRVSPNFDQSIFKDKDVL